MKLSFYRITDKDLSFVNETRNGYAAEYLHDSRVFTLQETVEWYNKTNPNYWIIFDESINEKVGYFRLSNHSVINKNIYIGADISPKFKNKGYGTEAYKKFIPLLFGFYDLHKISLEVLETNTVAIRLYEKVGFVREGVKRHEVCKNGSWINSIVMSYLNPKNKLFSVAISFYLGKRNVFHQMAKIDPVFYVRKNIEYINKLNTKVHKVYLICTFGHDVDKDKTLAEVKKIIGDDERFILKTRVNFGGSYASWHLALDIDNGTSDYIVLMEDDFVLYNKDSIEYMLGYWENNEKLLYVCSKFESNTATPIIHASLPSGMINNKLYHYLKKYKNLDFKLIEFRENISDHYKLMCANQIDFLKAYQDNQIEIRDFSDKYSAYYINTERECGVQNGEIIFCPIADKFM